MSHKVTSRNNYLGAAAKPVQSRETLGVPCHMTCMHAGGLGSSSTTNEGPQQARNGNTLAHLVGFRLDVSLLGSLLNVD